MDGLDQLHVRWHDSKAIVDAAHEFSLQLLWQEASTSDQWLVGPLFRENLIDDGI